ncbi:MAG: ABC transporter ATP-binding protein [Chitinophagales bacterium]
MIHVAAHHLTKSYGKEQIKAVDDVSFSVEKGELFGLIGPDGAGKTSILRMLTTLILPDSGDAQVDGMDVVKDFKAIRQIVGYMPGKFSLYQDLTIEENLTFFATVFKTTVEENYDLIKDIYVQIEPFKNRRAGALSGGMKQKLALCCALIHRPTILFLDEPTTGVDTVSRKEFWNILKNLKQQGITIIVSTPYMDEATLCERIALLQDGKILSIDTPQQIIKDFPNELFAIKSDQMIKLLSDLRTAPLIKSCFSFGEFHHISFATNQSDNTNELTAYLTNLQHSHIEIKPISPTIEDCFIQLMSN